MKFEEAQKVKALIVNAIHITDEKLIYLGGKLGAKSGAIVHGMIEQRFHGVFEEINGMVDYAKEDNRCETCGRPCDYIPYESSFCCHCTGEENRDSVAELIRCATC